MIPAVINKEIPLPMPRSVICSPSHIKKTAPAVSVSTVISRKPQPLSSSRPALPSFMVTR